MLSGGSASLHDEVTASVVGGVGSVNLWNNVVRFRHGTGQDIFVLLRTVFHPSLIKFALTGVLNTLVGLGIIYGLKWFLAMPDTPANVLGYAVGLLFSYQVNSRWTFQYRERLLPVLPRYLLVMLLAYVCNLACLHLALALGVDSYLAQALTVLPYAAVGYLGMRFWVFKDGIQKQ